MYSIQLVIMVFKARASALDSDGLGKEILAQFWEPFHL